MCKKNLFLSNFSNSSLRILKSKRFENFDNRFLLAYKISRTSIIYQPDKDKTVLVNLKYPKSKISMSVHEAFFKLLDNKRNKSLGEIVCKSCMKDQCMLNVHPNCNMVLYLYGLWSSLILVKTHPSFVSENAVLFDFRNKLLLH